MKTKYTNSKSTFLFFSFFFFGCSSPLPLNALSARLSPIDSPAWSGMNQPDHLTASFFCAFHVLLALAKKKKKKKVLRQSGVWSRPPLQRGSYEKANQFFFFF